MVQHIWKPYWLGILIMGVVIAVSAGLAQAQSVGVVPPLTIGPSPGFPLAPGAGNLEPPSAAVDGAGNPATSTPTQPSWDQTLRADDGNADTGCNSTRFKCVMGGAAVLDKETGLVWEQSPLTTEDRWPAVRGQCTIRTVGGRNGWRLPSVHELASLMDPGNSGGNPDLPLGHPFSNVQSSLYWSASTDADLPTFAWVVNFDFGNVFPRKKSSLDFVWCVRGGHNDGSAY